MTPTAPSPTGPLVLGIETSCDETAAAVVGRDADGRARILSNVVLSQIDEHAAFGGVVPEIAARAHAEAIGGIVRAALDEAGVSLREIGAVAATVGPGLVGGLIVGQVPVEGVEFVMGQQVDVFPDERHRKQMTADIELHPPVRKARIDGVRHDDAPRARTCPTLTQWRAGENPSATAVRFGPLPWPPPPCRGPSTRR